MEDPHSFRSFINEKLTHFVSLLDDKDLTKEQEKVLDSIDRFICNETGIDIKKFPNYD
jgi:hypothetical protein|tara:strand:- start:787 stop:960 length:174 start_codon:yes stop_codon:yes gene_type:complete